MPLLPKRREWCPFLLICAHVLSGVHGNAVTDFVQKECLKDVVFRQHVLFTSSARSTLECARICSKTPECLTFTFARPLCQGHKEVMTPFDERLSLLGAKTFVRRGAVSTPPIQCKKSHDRQMMHVPVLGDIEVFCEDSWIVILRRSSDLVDFFVPWEDYKFFFGDLLMDFWLGLETLHQLTSGHVDAVSGSPWQLMVDLGDWDDDIRQALYTNFSVGPESQLYTLSLNFSHGSAGDSISMYSGVPFSTLDRDNDESNKSCADKLHGAWWYRSCTGSNLCGRFYRNSTAPDKDGVTWKTWHGTGYSLKFAQLKIKMVLDIC